MKSALLLYPHQLFEPLFFPEGISTVFVVEEPLLFGTDKEYPAYFHKQKLVLHRASMRRYVEEVLWPAGYDVEYIEFHQLQESGDVLQRLEGYEKAFYFDVVDDILQRRLLAANRMIPNIPVLTFVDSPNFYLKREEVRAYFGKSSKTLFATFYQWQRERFNILIGDNYKPVGGKWSFDADNRRRLPKEHTLPSFQVFGANQYVDEANQYVEKHFADNLGSTADFPWPTSHAEAHVWLKEFIEGRLKDFGPYEDAIDGQAPWVYHSGISAPLNIGLLHPRQVIEAVLEYYAENSVPLESVEGFIRQVLGWREYVRGIYETRHVPLRTSNVFEHNRKLTDDWYAATTGIPPVDDVIRKLHTRAYAHHIERLMVVGNMMFLSEIDPKQVYQWYMEFFIDAYDWVMVPNIFGMSQFSDGGSMVTKPYVSGSNYVLKMSYYPKDTWCDIWDGLFWRFVDNHRAMLLKNPRMSMMVHQYDRMDDDRKRIIGYRADDFLREKTSE